MYLRKCRKSVAGAEYVYWQLVESQRTARGPRQRVVAYLSDIEEAYRLGTAAAVNGNGAWQEGLLADTVKPEWVEVDTARLRVERVVDFGPYWLGMQIMAKLGLTEFLAQLLAEGREKVPWSAMALVLVLMRLVDPSSELRIAENLFERSALADLLGIPASKVNDDRLYRALDRLRPHKAALAKYLQERLGRLFGLDYDLLLYDITSTYFEGLCPANEAARYGYSRDKRSDCKQVCIGLVVSREGVPLGYEVFAGNRADVSTVQEIVEKIEAQYGRAQRVWVMDRGMASQRVLAHLQSGGRRYIVGTPRSQLRQFAAELASEEGWTVLGAGVWGKVIAAEDGQERFLLCRSEARGAKERAMLERFAQRIEEGLRKLAAACAGQRKLRQAQVERRLGALLSENSRAKGLFQVQVGAREDGGARLVWARQETASQWAQRREGCYLLRTNVEGSAAELWRSYMQLTEAEAAFRIQKSDLRIRPIWHQRQERVEAHILVCFLAYVLWKTLARMCKAAGLGDEPRQVLDELGSIKMMDVVLPTRGGVELRRRCVSRPAKGQAVLLDKLKLRLPAFYGVTEM